MENILKEKKSGKYLVELRQDKDGFYTVYFSECFMMDGQEYYKTYKAYRNADGKNAKATFRRWAIAI